MRQITENTLEESILNKYIPQGTVARELLIRQVNECYQHIPKIFKEVNNGNYAFIENCLKLHIYKSR
jgi:hypothetical protein